jgi:hypothetical protein
MIDLQDNATRMSFWLAMHCFEGSSAIRTTLDVSSCWMLFGSGYPAADAVF